LRTSYGVVVIEYCGSPGPSEAPLIAAGIFRGEGNIGCKLRKVHGGRYTPFTYASVQMCNKESVAIVASEWECIPIRVPPMCPKTSEVMWRATIGGNQKVRRVMLGWIANGWLTGEKAGDILDATAKCRRARRAFVKRERRL